LKKSYEDNIARLKTELGEGESFDIVVRPLRVMGKKAALICIDGFAKDDILTEVMEFLLLLRREIIGASIHKTLLTKGIPYIETNTEQQIEKVLQAVLSGAIILIVDGCDEAFIIDARTYPAREPAEPDVERVVRGSRDGFTETLVFNTALLRRRIRDNRLRIKLFTVGQRSKTDVCVCYLQDIVIRIWSIPSVKGSII
jgi:stage V sporulation protein AF